MSFPRCPICGGAVVEIGGGPRFEHGIRCENGHWMSEYDLARFAASEREADASNIGTAA